MKYLLLIYTNAENWEHPMYRQSPEFQTLPQGERDALIRQEEALYQDVSESGELVGGAALADPTNTRRLRVRDGVPAITDGPYLEAKEQLAGYFVIDCDSLERATEIAARVPDARFATVEVRPIMSSAGQEM